MGALRAQGLLGAHSQALCDPPPPPYTQRATPHLTRARPGSANADACELLSKKGEGAYKERVLKYAAEYPALLAALKAKEKFPGK